MEWDKIIHPSNSQIQGVEKKTHLKFPWFRGSLLSNQAHKIWRLMGIQTKYCPKLHKRILLDLNTENCTSLCSYVFQPQNCLPIMIFYSSVVRFSFTEILNLSVCGELADLEWLTSTLIRNEHFLCHSIWLNTECWHFPGAAGRVKLFNGNFPCWKCSLQSINIQIIYNCLLLKTGIPVGHTSNW